MFHKPETSLSWKECLNQPQVGFASFFFILGGSCFTTSRNFSNSQGKEFWKNSSIYGWKHHFQPTKTRPLPPKNQSSNPPRPKNPSPRLVGRIGGIRITGLHLGYPRTAGGPRFSQWSPGKTTRWLHRFFNFQSILVGGGVFGRLKLPTFQWNYQFLGGLKIWWLETRLWFSNFEGHFRSCGVSEGNSKTSSQSFTASLLKAEERGNGFVWWLGMVI